MKFDINTLKQKLNLKNGGSPLLGILLFVIMFSLTLWILGGNPGANMDSYELGQTMKALVTGERGEVVATINGTEYYERDLQIIKQNMLSTSPQYNSLSEKQQRMLAGDQLVRQFMIIMEFDRLQLEVSQEDCDAYIEAERRASLDMISKEEENGEVFLRYIDGYGCEFEEYWQDSNVRESFVNSLKYDMAQEKIAELQGEESLTNMEMNEYLTKLIEDKTYVITLFGESFGDE